MIENILFILDNPYLPDPRVKKQIKTLINDLNLNVILVCTKSSKINFETIYDSKLIIYRVLDQDIIYKYYKNSLESEIQKISEIILKYEIKILHAHDHISLNLAVILKKKFPFKIIYDAHEYISGWYYYKNEKNLIKRFKGFLIHRIYSLKESRNLKCIDELITVSNSLGSLYREKKSLEKILLFYEMFLMKKLLQQHNL